MFLELQRKMYLQHRQLSEVKKKKARKTQETVGCTHRGREFQLRSLSVALLEELAGHQLCHLEWEGGQLTRAATNHLLSLIFLYLLIVLISNVSLFWGAGNEIPQKKNVSREKNSKFLWSWMQRWKVCTGIHFVFLWNGAVNCKKTEENVCHNVLKLMIIARFLLSTPQNLRMFYCLSCKHT